MKCILLHQLSIEDHYKCHKYKAWLQFTSQDDPFEMEKEIRNFFHVDWPLKIASIEWRQMSRKSRLYTVLCSLYNKTSSTTISDCRFTDLQVPLPRKHT